MKIVFIFPGYGAQFVGMAKDLYDESRIMQEYFEEASHCLSTNVVKLCFASSEAKLARIPEATTSLFLISSALVSMLRSNGIDPDCVVGYNTGDYAALYAAQAITFSDGLYLLSKYANKYQSFVEKTDFIVSCIDGFEVEKVEQVCQEISKDNDLVYIAVVLNKSRVYIAGSNKAVAMVGEKLNIAKVNSCKSPGVGVGLHSPIMKRVQDEFKGYLEKVGFKKPAALYINAQANILTTQDQLYNYVIERVCMPINWHATMQTLSAYDCIVQIGPGELLMQLVKEQYSDKMVFRVSTKAEFDTLCSYVLENSTADMAENKDQEQINE